MNHNPDGYMSIVIATFIVLVVGLLLLGSLTYTQRITFEVKADHVLRLVVSLFVSALVFELIAWFGNGFSIWTVLTGLVLIFAVSIFAYIRNAIKLGAGVSKIKWRDRVLRVFAYFVVAPLGVLAISMISLLPS